MIDTYIADFACREKKLVIEIDGSQHLNAVEYDELRTKHLMVLDYNILRFWNHEVLNNIRGVLNTILNALKYIP